MADSTNDLVLSFEVYRGSELIKAIEYTTESITIGSGATALLAIPDSPLAELHAVINVQDDGVVQLLDLGSEIGTSLNGEQVTTNATLSSGDRVSFGEIEMVVNIVQDSAFDDEEATVVGSAALFTPEPATLHANTPEETEVDRPEPVVDEPTAPGSMSADQAYADDQEEATDPGIGPTPLPPKAEEPVSEPDDIMASIMRAGASTSQIGIDAKRPKVLEINQVWDNVLLDTRHYVKNHGRHVTIGSAVGWKWNLLGIDMGWVPVPLQLVLPFAPPMWSEVVSDWRNDFYAPEDTLPGRDHKIFHWNNDETFTASIVEGWDGFVDLGDDRFSFEDLVQQGHAKKVGSTYEIPMVDDLTVVVDVDGIIFHAHMVNAGERVITRGSEQVDYPFIGMFSLFIFIGLMFGIAMATLEPAPVSEMIEIPDRFVDLLLEQPEKEEMEKRPDSNPDAGEGAKAKREEGKVGKKDAKMERAKGNKIDMAKQQRDREIAEDAGVLGALRDGSELDGVFGSSGLDSSITGGIGGLIGAKGTQIGSGGLGSRGSGLGGGGTAEGLGGLGTKGIGSGSSGYGSGGGSFGAKSDGTISAVSGDPIILGALDRSLIDEVIKRHMNQIRYCYQRELTRTHNLQGKIVIKFVIARDGSVSSASVKNTTMSNAAVEQCVVSRFMRMQFPSPKGGGIVIVSYPFLFSPG